MKYKDVIFFPLIDLLNEVTLKINAELDKNDNGYNDNDNVNYNERLAEYLFKLEAFIENLERQSTGNGEAVLLKLQNFLLEEEFTAVFVEEQKLVKINALLGGSVLFEQDEDFDFDEIINFPVEVFKLISDPGTKLPFACFAYVNQANPDDSIAYVDFNRKEWTDQASAYFSTPFLGCLLFLVANASNFNSPFIAVRREASASTASSVVRFQAVAHGNIIHVPVQSTLSVEHACVANITTDQPYQQFNELILIVSEYNSRSEILSKFLSLYHVIESFMFKIPLVELGGANQGKMFSLRDFKRMYRRLDQSEGESIKVVMKGFWETSIAGKPFREYVSEGIAALAAPGAVQTEVDLFLARLGLFPENGFSQLSNGISAGSYANFLYSVRNAIVHNGETELHISHYNLTPTISALIEQVLMYPIVRLVISLIADNSSKVWYKGPALQLYQN